MKDKMDEEIKKMIQGRGYRVEMDTLYCDTHKKSHGNCADCESEQGCARLAAILILQCSSFLYKPANYQDFLDQTADVKEKMERILDENCTLKEMRKII